MNEEQAVLDFFSKEENLPLALSVAELTDKLRQQYNNRFWLALAERIRSQAPNWNVEITEDREVSERIVGIYLRPMQEQHLFLCPMLEQQIMGGVPRIYFGLMWSEAPTADKASLDAVTSLRDALQSKGYKNNERFLAWRWSSLYPTSKEMLSRFASQTDGLLDEASSLLLPLLQDFESPIKAANAALRDIPASATISLDQLRSKVKRS